jgi:hypothetical protein
MNIFLLSSEGTAAFTHGLSFVREDSCVFMFQQKNGRPALVQSDLGKYMEFSKIDFRKKKC